LSAYAIVFITLIIWFIMQHKTITGLKKKHK